MTNYRSALPEGVELLKRLARYLQRAGDTSSPTEGVVCSEIYRGRNVLYQIQCPEGDFVAKHFGKLGFLRSTYYGWSNSSKARRSYLNALQLQMMEFLTPEPIGYIETHSPLGALTDSYYVCRYIEATEVTLQPYAAGEAYSEDLIRALGHYLAELHECGVIHEDLSPGNLPYVRDEATGRYDFYLIDLNRMRFAPHPLSPRESIRSLERLFHARRACATLAEAYTERRGWEFAPFSEALEKACDRFWLRRLPKLALRFSTSTYGLSTRRYLRLYDGYLWTRRIRHLLPASSLRLKLFEREEAFYQRYLRAEDVRRSLARREGYSH